MTMTNQPPTDAEILDRIAQGAPSLADSVIRSAAPPSQAIESAGDQTMPIILTLTLAGRTYPIRAKMGRHNRDWRTRLRQSTAPVQTVLGLLSQARGQTWGIAFNSLDTADIAATAKESLPMLMGSIDEAADLLFAYDPALTRDQDYILDHETDESILAAFLKLLETVYVTPGKKLIPAANG